ncbi:DUF742 domain-containing protein [Saccharomonospora glauca]|nr:DUF742 domain-containing protein [Saccharomonospora glauca]
MWVRPYTVTNGRTHPSTVLELMSLVRTTGKVAPERLGHDHAQVLRLCQSPISVAEVAAVLKQPVMVAKVLLSDLIQLGAAATRAPSQADSTDPALLEALLDGLQRL